MLYTGKREIKVGAAGLQKTTKDPIKTSQISFGNHLNIPLRYHQSLSLQGLRGSLTQPGS